MRPVKYEKIKVLWRLLCNKGLESMRSVNAFGRHDLEEERLRKASVETMTAALRCQAVKGAARASA